jgi:hypothetical protein
MRTVCERTFWWQNIREFDEDRVQGHILHLLPDECVLDFRDKIFRMEHCMSTYMPFSNSSSHDLRPGFSFNGATWLGAACDFLFFSLERMVRIMNGICIGVAFCNTLTTCIYRDENLRKSHSQQLVNNLF